MGITKHLPGYILIEISNLLDTYCNLIKFYIFTYKNNKQKVQFQ